MFKGFSFFHTHSSLVRYASHYHYHHYHHRHHRFTQQKRVNFFLLLFCFLPSPFSSFFKTTSRHFPHAPYLPNTMGEYIRRSYMLVIHSSALFPIVPSFFFFFSPETGNPWLPEVADDTHMLHIPQTKFPATSPTFLRTTFFFGRATKFQIFLPFFLLVPDRLPIFSLDPKAPTSTSLCAATPNVVSCKIIAK